MRSVAINFVVLVLALVFGCEDVDDARTTDAVQRDDVIAALQGARGVRTEDVRIEIEGDRVLLAGRVHSERTHRSAIEAVLVLSGVRTVVDELEIVPFDGRSDLQIATDVRRAFARHPDIDLEQTEIEVVQGHVYLYGGPDRPELRETAQDMARKTPSVVAVHAWFNLDRVRDRPSDGELTTRVRRELIWSPFVDEDDVGVTVEHGVATLRGIVETADECTAAEENAREAGVVDVHNRIVVAP